MIKIRHCLFWCENNMITALLSKNGSLQLMKFGGRLTIPFTEKYWDEWIEHSGFCSDDQTDFCIIFDEEPFVPEKLLAAQCGSSDSIWSRAKIQKAVEILGIDTPTVLRTENDALICRIGSSRHGFACTTLTAKFVHAENETEKTDEPAEMTPFIQYNLEKFHKYKENSSR